MKKKLKNGMKVVARVAEMGGLGKRRCPYSYSEYEYDYHLKSGFRLVRKLSDWTAPNNTNDRIFEALYPNAIEGRPSIENPTSLSFANYYAE